MSEQIHKGWLTTRTNEKYAPATLIENVFTRSGLKYDDQVRKYIDSLIKSVNTNNANINAQLSQQSADIFGLSQDLTSLESKFANINTDDSSAFYIVDNNNNVVAYVDATGIHTVEINIKGAGTFSDLCSEVSIVKNTIANLASADDEIKESLKNVDFSDNDKIFIIDGSQNVIAYIDSDGLHVVNLAVKDCVDYHTLANQVTSNSTEIGSLQQQINQNTIEDANRDTIINEILDNTAAFNGIENNDAFYIIDANNNVIGYFDAAGLHVVDVISGENRLNSSLSTLFANFSTLEQNLSTETSQRESGDNQLSTQISNCLSQIGQEVTARQNADKGLQDKIDLNSKNLSDEINNRTEADNSLQQKIGENTNAISAQAIANATQDSRLDSLESNTKNFDGKDSDAFYIIDSNNNTVAYINNTGIHAINFYSGKGSSVIDINSSFSDLYAKFSALDTEQQEETSNRIAADNTLSGQIANLTSSVNSEIGSLKAKDEALQKSITTNSTNITTETKNRQDEDKKLQDAISTINTEISGLKGVDSSYNARIDAVESKLKDVSSVMDFVGVFKTLPSVSSHQKGDVCIVEAKEYVHNGVDWILLGDTSAEATRLTTLEKIVGTPEGSETSHEERLDSLSKQLADEIASRNLANDLIHTRIDPIETSLEEVLKIYNWYSPDDKTLYIMDGSDNVLAYFDSTGLNIINVLLKSGNQVKNMKTDAIFMETSESKILTWLD